MSDKSDCECFPEYPNDCCPACMGHFSDHDGSGEDAVDTSEVTIDPDTKSVSINGWPVPTLKDSGSDAVADDSKEQQCCRSCYGSDYESSDDEITKAMLRNQPKIELIEDDAPLVVAERPKSTIGFIMVSGSEQMVIERALGSITSLADKYYVSYNGTDDTPKHIQEFMESHNIPGCCEFEPWLDYGHNKTILLQRAQEVHLKDCTYLLWCDADEVFFDTHTDLPPTPETKQRLVEYLDRLAETNEYFQVFIPTHVGTLENMRWNIIRNNDRFYWDIPAHEALVSYRFGYNVPSFFMTDILTLVARNEGERALVRENGHYSKPREYVRMYNAGLKRDPSLKDKERFKFYYAQELQNTGDIENLSKAVKYYMKRIDDPRGNTHERYISMLRLGRLFVGTEASRQRGIDFLLRANTEFSTRFEALHALMLLWTDDAVNRLSLLPLIKSRMSFWINTSDINPIIFNSLFPEVDTIRYMFAFQSALIMHLVGDNQLAVMYNHYVLDRMPSTHAQYERTKINHSFYEKALLTSPTMKASIPVAISDAVAGASTPTITASSDIVAKSDNPLENYNSDRPPSLIIYDNFFSDPEAVRLFALKQSFNVSGNYPGTRTVSFKNDVLKKRFEQLTGGTITYWPDEYNGSFQWTDRKMESWIHRDATDYAAIIYLSPNAPIGTGTTFYKHRVTGLEKDGDANETRLMNEDSRHYNNWEVVDVVANKFNRLILFDGRRSHQSSAYFGIGLEGGRLFQTFFFNVVKK